MIPAKQAKIKSSENHTEYQNLILKIEKEILKATTESKFETSIIINDKYYLALLSELRSNGYEVTVSGSNQQIIFNINWN